MLEIQEYKNGLSLKRKGSYRIMCIGESTTQGQYPPFLEDILNKSNAGVKFSVIDKGVAGTNTSIISSQLEENLRKYSPDMVVAMIGINDKGIYMPVGFNRSPQGPLIPLKVYKLAQLLSMHIQNTIEEIKGNWLYPGGLISSAKNIETPFQNSVGAQGVMSDEQSEIPSDNEGVFENALKECSYKDLFKDMYAGNFGHCTQKGNKLLAENIANAILKKVFNVPFPM